MRPRRSISSQYKSRIGGPSRFMISSRWRQVPSNELFFKLGHSLSNTSRTLARIRPKSSCERGFIGLSAAVISSESISLTCSGFRQFSSLLTPMTRCVVFESSASMALGAKKNSRFEGRHAIKASGSYMWKCLTRSHIESSGCRSTPSPPQKVSQNHWRSQRAGNRLPRHASAHKRLMDSRCAQYTRQTTGFGTGHRTMRS
mmetsp:Transcript_30004/g.86359  ORF Transcript_30004/g.86359 Transcript_30004/m.86359 type:complete len:201 (-) Transcript_30004:947-1549(-)